MNDTTSNCGNIWIRAFTADGFQVSLTLPAQSVADAMAHLDAVRAAGLLTMMPDSIASEESEIITTVMRRTHVNEKSGEVTPVIDMYPDWRGDFGTYRFAGLYLNTADDIAEFEAQSGLKLADIPLYDGQTPLKRSQRQRHRCETPVKSPFLAFKSPVGEKEIDGKMQTVYRFSRYGTAPAAAQAPAPSAPAPRAPEPAPQDDGWRVVGTVEEIEVRKTAKGGRQIVAHFTAESGAPASTTFYTREPFRQMGGVWAERAEGWTEPKVYDVTDVHPAAALLTNGNEFIVRAS